MIKAVIFDLDDTLYDYETVHKIAMERLCTFTCKKLNILKEQFLEAFSWAKARTKKTLGNTGASHNRMLYCQKTLEHLGLNPVEGALEMYNCYWDSILADMKLRDGTIHLFKKLKANGIKIAICTDLTAHIQHRKIRALGLVPYIDVLVTSEEAGIEKPGKEIYSLILEKLDLPASACLFVGDSLEKDVEAPKHYGMEGILFTTIEDLEKKIYER